MPHRTLPVILVLAVTFFVGAAEAQFRGSLRGTVTDSQGEVVSGATVTLTDTATNRTLGATSDANGIYEFNALAPDPYQLTVEHEGFTKKVLEQVQIIPEQPNSLNLQLEVGKVQTTVTVSGTTQALDTETATLSGTITSNQIQNMPSFGRDVTKLTVLAPGVFGDNAQGSAGGSESIPGTGSAPVASAGNTGIFATENLSPILSSGNQAQNNGISIDGISTTSAVWGGSTVITPSEDSVDSVKIVSNSYDAENSRFSGAQIQIISKSGSNQVHGSLFFAMQRPNLNATQRYNGHNQKDLRDPYFFDQFGGSVGGPIWKNKIFAFFNYETVRTPANVPVQANGWYDTAAFDALASAGGPIANTYLTFPGSGVIATGINPSTCTDAGLAEGVNCVTIPGQGLNLGTPLTTGAGTQDLGWTQPTNPGCGGAGTGCGTTGSPLGTTADIANFQTVSSSSSTHAQYNGRLDANITSKDSLAFAIYWVPQSFSSLNGPARAYNLFHYTQINDAFSVVWNHTISSSFLNEARVNAAGWRWNQITSNPQSPVGLPTDSIQTIGSITPKSFGPNVGSIYDQWTYTYKDVATKIIGRHTIKFGGDLTRLSYLQNCAGCGIPSYSFFNLWDFLNDAPATEFEQVNPTNGAPSTIRQDDRENLWGLFAQDDYKLRRNLTVNLGVRYSYFSPLSSKEGNMFVATPGAGSAYLTGLTVHKGNSWNSQKTNFGPEIGFAWSPGRFHDRIVIRGGYGLNYNQEEIAISSSIVNNPGLVVTPFLSSASPSSINPDIIYGISTNVHSLFGYPANPNLITTLGPNGLPPAGSAAVGVQIFPNTLPTMYVEHYSLDIQNDLGHNWIMSLGYLGTLSRHFFFNENPNAAPVADGFALNQQINGGNYWAVNDKANYNALLAEVKHQFSHGFMSDAQFTWSKSLDDSSGPYAEQDYPYNPSLNYGPSDYNVGKAFKLYSLWQPVLFHTSRSWMEKVAGGWTLSGIFYWHSGFPWTPTASVPSGSLYCGSCGYNSLPALYLGGAGNSTSNNTFKGPAAGGPNLNYPLGGTAYFAAPAFPPPYTCSPTTPSICQFGSALPQVARRNFLTGPGYRDVDMTLAKSFGLPHAPVLGENAKLELRMDVFNVFNNLNFNPGSISNNIANSNFGVAQSALAARVVALTARFSF